MRLKFYSALATLGLAATALAKAGYAEIPAPTTAMGSVIDTSLHSTGFRFTLPKPPNSIWALTDVAPVRSIDFSQINLALSGPALLFGIPHEFFALSVHFGSAPTTAVVFPSLSK